MKKIKKYSHGGPHPEDTSTKTDTTGMHAYYNPPVFENFSTYIRPNAFKPTSWWDKQKGKISVQAMDYLYKNPELFDYPVLGNILRDQAYKYASQSSAPVRQPANIPSDEGTYKGGQPGDDYALHWNNPDVLKQYFTPHDKKTLDKAQYKPVDDYYEFLPTYSVKGDFETSVGALAQQGTPVRGFEQKYGKEYTPTNFTKYFTDELLESKNISYEDFIKNKKPVFGTSGIEPADGGSWSSDEVGADMELFMNTDYGAHKQGLGWDEQLGLPYFSVADAWDFEPQHYAKKWGHDFNTADETGYNKEQQVSYVQSSLMHKAGYPYKMYDRYYFDPETRKYISDEDIIKRRTSTQKYGGKVRNYQDGGPTDPPTDPLAQQNQEYITQLQSQAAAGSEMAIQQLQSLGQEARIPDADFSAGMAEYMPVTGEISDAMYTADALSQGNYGDAALYSAGFMLPFVPGTAIKKGFKHLKNKYIDKINLGPGNIPVQKGRTLSVDDAINLRKQNIKISPELASAKPELYLHGTNSAAFSGIRSNKGLVPAGQLDSSTGLFSGERGHFFGPHANQTGISTTRFDEVRTPLTYSGAYGPQNTISPLDDYNRFVDDMPRISKKFGSDVAAKMQASKLQALNAYTKSSPIEKTMIEQPFPAVFGINPKSRGRLDTRSLQSDIANEQTILGKVGYDELSNVYVPKSRMKDAKDYFGGNINVMDLESIAKLNKNKAYNYQWKKYGGTMKNYNNIPGAGWGDMFKKLGQQVKTGLAGAVQGATGGIIPTTKLLRPELREEYADEMKMGNLFGSTVGFLGGAGLFGGAGAVNAATSAAGMSSVPGANTFNALYGSGINPAMMNPSLAGASSGALGFNNLFNMGSNFGAGNAASGMFNIYQQGQEGMAMGGRATNMKQNMGQDINVESGELLMSDMGGRFQSMNPKAPIKEVMPGVSMVQGNQSNDNVPIKIPDGETKVFSKRLGYADKGLELVNQYKELEKTPDSNDFIGQQTKKFELNKIRKKLEELFQEQEKSKSKQIAKRTGGTKIPQAGLGDIFNKAKTFMQSDTGRSIGNFALENMGSLYNMGVGAFSPNPQTFNIDDYVPDYNPDPKLTKINTKNILSPMYDELASSRYAINQSGGTPGEIIQGNMLLNAKALNKIGATESKAEALQRNLDLGVYDTGFKAATNKGLQGLRLDMMNQQMLSQRPGFFKEGLEGFQNYFTGKRNEDFMGNIYNQRYGNLPGSQLGTGNTNFDMQYGFGQYNPGMPAPSLNPSSFTGSNLFSGFNLGN